MKLHVKNFGPIREAEVELKPLTIFVGINALHLRLSAKRGR